MIGIELIQPERLEADITGLTEAYHLTYSQQPYYEPYPAAKEFSEGVLKSRQFEGFRIALARSLPENRIVGFAYGTACRPGGWWHDTVTRGLSPAVLEKWFSDAFEFVEFGVIPEYQRQGIGSRLHEKLFSSLNYRTAVLNVMQAEIPAMLMYRKLGWVTIRADFLYHAGDHPCTIMGLDLAQYHLISKEKN